MLKIYPPKNPLHYQDPRGSAKTIFLDSLSACKDMPNAGSSRNMEPFPGSCFQKFWFRNFNIMQFKQGDVFLRKNPIHSFENALLGGCHFSRVPQIGLMSVARFSWVPNLYNIHFLLENHRPQPDPVNSHRVVLYILTSKRASRHNGVYFFDISTSKSGPNP